jgi:hypothetical protein
LLVARLWARQQGIGLRYAQKLSRSQWHTLRYESLVSEPEAQLRQICGFLGEPYADSMLGFSSSREAQEMARQSASWRHVDSSIFCTSIGRHRVKLTRREITEVESVAGKLMARLGYEPSCQAARVTMPRNFVVYLLEAVRRVMIEISAVFSDCNFWRRWRRAGYLVWLHLTRSQLLSFRPRRITARENRSDP